jgi:hypothetical protein
LYTSSTKAVEKEYKWKSIVIEIISSLKTVEIDGGSNKRNIKSYCRESDQ